MEPEKKLIVFSVLSVLIGVASIVPISFIVSAKAQEQNQIPKPDAPWFSLNVVYAYFEGGRGLLYNFPSAPFTYYVQEDLDHWYARTFRFYNFSILADLQNEHTDRIEYFRVQIESDKGLILNETQGIGTYGVNVGLRDTMLNYSRTHWLNIPDCGAGFLSHNTTRTWTPQGSGAICNGSGSGSISPSMIGQAESINITVQRLGWVTFSSNDTMSIHFSDEVLQQVQLERYGNGFLYNTLLPEDVMAATDPCLPLTAQISKDYVGELPPP